MSVNDGFSCRWLDFTQYHCENAAVPGTNYCEKHTENLANYADYLQRMYGEPR